LEFTKETLEKMEEKKSTNLRYASYLYYMSKDSDVHFNSKSLVTLNDRLTNCLDYWTWDKYEKNRLLDLKTVNRCNNNRWCPNCRKWDLASAIHNFRPVFSTLINEGYYPYHCVLTLPNCRGDDLKTTIEKMNIAFRKFYHGLEKISKDSPRSFNRNIMPFEGALKVLEITVRHDEEGRTIDFHPHFHCILFSRYYIEENFIKDIPGGWSTKRQEYDKFSEMDLHIMKMWKMAVDDIRYTNNEYDSMSNDWFDLYMCYIEELDQNGVYEVLKYTFKDSDISTYFDFKIIFQAIYGKRIRQGHGILYNLKLESDTDGELQSIEEYLEEKEIPSELVTKEIKELYTVYIDYKKISRFRASEELKNLD
jgi:plasmid rolling circle replication initiator protein Rep